MADSILNMELHIFLGFLLLVLALTVQSEDVHGVVTAARGQHVARASVAALVRGPVECVVLVSPAAEAPEKFIRGWPGASNRAGKVVRMYVRVRVGRRGRGGSSAATHPRAHASRGRMAVGGGGRVSKVGTTAPPREGGGTDKTRITKHTHLLYINLPPTPAVATTSKRAADSLFSVLEAVERVLAAAAVGLAVLKMRARFSRYICITNARTSTPRRETTVLLLVLMLVLVLVLTCRAQRGKRRYCLYK